MTEMRKPNENSLLVDLENGSMGLMQLALRLRFNILLKTDIAQNAFTAEFEYMKRFVLLADFIKSDFRYRLAIARGGLKSLKERRESRQQ